jgi:hypothetical protein
MPYIALQRVDIESVLTVMGVGSTSGNALVSAEILGGVEGI